MTMVVTTEIVVSSCTRQSLPAHLHARATGEENNQLDTDSSAHVVQVVHMPSRRDSGHKKRDSVVGEDE